MSHTQVEEAPPKYPAVSHGEVTETEDEQQLLDHSGESDTDSDEDIQHNISEFHHNYVGENPRQPIRPVRNIRSEIDRLSNGVNEPLTISRTRASNKNKSYSMYR